MLRDVQAKVKSGDLSFWGVVYMPHAHPKRLSNAPLEPIITPDAFLDLMERWRPSSLTMMDGVDLAKQAHERLAGFGTQIVYRYATEDNALYKRYTPKAFLDKVYAELGDYPIAVKLANEGECHEPAYIRWQCEVIDENNQRRRHPLVGGGFSVGTPSDRDYGRYDGLLRRLSANPEIYALIVHEYSLVWPLSDLYRGPEWRQFENLPDNPLLTDDGKARRQLSHVGRIADMMYYCREHSQPFEPPLTIIGEIGFDGMEDLKTWVEGLKFNQSMDGRLGWRALTPQWEIWRPDMTPEQIYFRTMRYWRDKIYSKLDFVISGHLFAKGDSGDGVQHNWINYRIDRSPKLVDMIVDEATAMRGESPWGELPDEPPLPLPDDDPPIEIQPPQPPPVDEQPPAEDWREVLSELRNETLALRDEVSELRGQVALLVNLLNNPATGTLKFKIVDGSFLIEVQDLPMTD